MRKICILLICLLLVISCGIPTFCTLNKLSFRKNANTDSSLTFTISGSEPDLGMFSNSGPGLLLCYVPYTLSEPSGASSYFASNVKNNLVVDANDKITDISDNTALFVARDKDSKIPSSPVFSKDLFSYIEDTNHMNCEITLTLNKFSKTLVPNHNNMYSYEVKSNFGDTFYIYTEDPDLQTNDNKYVHLYGAVVAYPGEGADFTYIYWSQLYYLGYFKLSSV